MFRFTIRDVLWLTALAAVLVAWWVDRRDHKVTVDTLRQVILNQRAVGSRVDPGSFFFW